MNEPGNIIGVFLGIFVGALMAFGLVLLFMFFGSSEACRSALYGLVFTFL